MDTKNSRALIGEERGKSKRENQKQTKTKGNRTAQPSRPKPLQLRKRG